MPDLEHRITDTLDRLGEQPDPARILQRVARRKKHFRLVHRAQTITLVVAVLAGVAGGMYALGRAFGIGALHPVPNNSSVPTPIHTSPSASPISPSPSGSTAVATPRCAAGSARATLESQNGAAGTLSTVWRITNLASTPCRSFGYPGMAFHTPSGWLEVNVIRG